MVNFSIATPEADNDYWALANCSSGHLDEIPSRLERTDSETKKLLKTQVKMEPSIADDSNTMDGSILLAKISNLSISLEDCSTTNGRKTKVSPDNSNKPDLAETKAKPTDVESKQGARKKNRKNNVKREKIKEKESVVVKLEDAHLIFF